MDNLGQLSIVLAAAGVFVHLVYFRFGEHHMYGVVYVQSCLIAYTISVCYLKYMNNVPIPQALSLVSLLFFAFLGGLYSSLLLYRAFFHPLKKFQGPFIARLSSFHLSTQLNDGQAYKKVADLHQKHGQFVRFGSSDLSITHPEAVALIYGNGTKCRKGGWYDLTKPMISMQTTRDNALHAKRRRIWSTAFSEKALRGYEQRMRTYRDQLTAQLIAFSGKPANASRWFNLYSFDVMGDLAFNTSFSMLARSEEHRAIKLLNEGLKPLQFMFPIWFFRFMSEMPLLMRDWFKFIDFCVKRVEQRMQTKVETPDIMSTLLEPLQQKEKPSKEDLAMLHGDSQLVIVAGSDTTATTLTHIFLELVRNPGQIALLRAESEPFIRLDGNVLHTDISSLDHLNAVIHETLRLHPPVPTSLQRLTPPEGIMIGETLVPGNINVICPQYAIGRTEAIYPCATAFIPERWTTQPGLLPNRSAFAPFSMGTHGCIGRPLAMLNLRVTVTELLHRFDVTFAPGVDGSVVDANSKEHFTLVPAELNLCFSRR